MEYETIKLEAEKRLDAFLGSVTFNLMPDRICQEAIPYSSNEIPADALLNLFSVIPIRVNSNSHTNRVENFLMNFTTEDQSYTTELLQDGLLAKPQWHDECIREFGAEEYEKTFLELFEHTPNRELFEYREQILKRISIHTKESLPSITSILELLSDKFDFDHGFWRNEFYTARNAG